MKTKTFFVLIISLIISKGSFSQSWLSYGPEIGINMSGIPRTQHLDFGVANDITQNETTWRPLFSPVVGFWFKADISKRFFTSLGIRYYWVGEKYHSSYASHYPPPLSITDLLDTWSNQKFHKITIPISVGYNFNVKKSKLFTFIGYTQSCYLSGKAFFKEQRVFNSYNHVEEHETNPFDKSQYQVTAKRWRPAINFGIGAAITHRINFALNCSPNWGIRYYNPVKDYEEIDLYGGGFKNTDWSLTINYSFK